MCPPKHVLTLLLVGTIVFSFAQLCAQQVGADTLVVNHLVGKVIDTQERDRYNLFPAAKGFQSATFLKLTNGDSVVSVISINEETGEEKTKTTLVTERTMKEYLRIINFIETQNGNKTLQLKLSKNKPPITMGGIVGQVLGGLGGGLVGVYAAHQLSGGYSNSESKNIRRSLVGYGLGTSLGIYAVGSSGNQTGSYIVTLLGTAIGWLPALPLFVAAEGGAVIVVLAPVLGGVAGFNVTRRYKKLPDMAFLNIRDGELCFAVPAVSLCPHPYAQGKVLYSVNVMRASF